ncbi:MAG: hypothetical protein QW559_02105 [Candidatus Woesearchaeota archaeon]
MPEELLPPIGTNIAPEPASQATEPSQQPKRLFKSKMPETTELSSLREELLSLSTRLRVSEERYVDFRRKLQLLEQNLLSNHKRVMEEIKLLLSETTELKKKIDEIENKLLLIVKELQLTAKREDVEVMKKYFELWSPVSFATISQVEKMIAEALQERQGDAEEEKT